MKSKWKPGDRVRVRATVTDGSAGLTGTIEAVNYAQLEAATSVLLDRADGALGDWGAFFLDDELEAE
ncbi:hypothetical protein GTY75_04995 [Streptomyces sp. SID8381]|uniref:hypothetical protein n=1 Tax=unclassified Streptomyces TaxID=2593676 RepID=UPI00036DC9E0|nr:MULTISPECIES: hypothetical protein [unclassified Streptomyces]MYX26031.1 hypothetical protein [Streptomyces sp. SID8381]